MGRDQVKVTSLKSTGSTFPPERAVFVPMRKPMCTNQSSQGSSRLLVEVKGWISRSVTTCC